MREVKEIADLLPTNISREQREDWLYRVTAGLLKDISSRFLYAQWTSETTRQVEMTMERVRRDLINEGWVALDLVEPSVQFDDVNGHAHLVWRFPPLLCHDHETLLLNPSQDDLEGGDDE